ncbi:hypothetical protein [Planomicrobium okeanokoites]|uniref:hypothetical protein n=1 Tax=Planomicrobium okeanokoites TaxID=244 RepID=UPI000A048D56|nr:hypothetical protein [Planomicrobium okeanokoites]
MSSMLSLFEAVEIRELLSFKKSALTKTKLFLESVKEHYHTEVLEEDIELSIQEIEDLKNILIGSSVEIQK